jgi:type VI secretion system secreted protein VgrG
MAITQKHREIEIATPLGEDVLLLTSFSGSEQLSRLFEYDLELASEDPAIKSADIVGQNVTIRLKLGGDKTRYFNGYISHFTQITAYGRLAKYRATMVPWLWFLTRTADCRIYQDQKVPEIIKQVFKKHEKKDFEEKFSNKYRTWEYCVQYRETDFNFVSRLMEQEGIYYFFKHENGKHNLVLADSPSAHESYPELKEIEYHAADKGVETKGCVSDWVIETHLQPVSFALNDFDFKDTKKALEVRANVNRKHAAAVFEVYDYPGEYTEPDDGDKYARKRIEELQAQYEVVTAQSDVRGICTGCTFKLTEHTRDDQNGDYLITSANYSVNAGEFYSGGEGSDELLYACSFTAIDAKQQFRAPRITPKPTVSGPQTAIVVGTSGEEIYTDEYGRVKVKFHWDRYSEADENSSCWIRVAQVWAGKNWGAIYTPRIGQEVIVEFLEGDPDQPIITGRVYNAQAKPPYDLPTNKTMSTLKSNSSKGGEGFNEIRFEDKKGEEQIFIHAEKDLDIRVKNDRFETVVNDRHLIVEKDKFEQVKSHRNEFVEKNHLEEIGEDRDLTVKGNEAKEVGKDLSLTVKGNVDEAFKKDHTEETTKNYTLKAKEVTIEAKSKIELKVGGSTITMNPGQIELNAPKISVSGSAMVQVQGGLVKIN